MAAKLISRAPIPSRRSLLSMVSAGVALAPAAAVATAAPAPLVQVLPYPPGADTALSGAFHHLGSLLLYQASPGTRIAKIVQALERLSAARLALDPQFPKIDWRAMAAKGPVDLIIGERFELEQARKALVRWEQRLIARERAART